MTVRVFADLHTHTTHSHGEGSVEDNVLAARARGLEMVAITDHGPANLFGVGVEDPHLYEESVRREIRECGEKYQDITILAGIEANVVTRDGRLDVPGDVLERLDIVLAGLHILIRGGTLGDTWALAGRNLLARRSAAIRRKSRVENTKALVEAVSKNPIDIITHPGLGVSIDTEELARACARAGTALEINAGHAHMDEDFIRVAAKQSVDFCINSDAHAPSLVGDFGGALEAIAKAGLDPGRVINLGKDRETGNRVGGVDDERNRSRIYNHHRVVRSRQECSDARL